MKKYFILVSVAVIAAMVMLLPFGFNDDMLCPGSKNCKDITSAATQGFDVLNAVDAVDAAAALEFDAVDTTAFVPVINWGVTPNTREQTPGVPAGSKAMIEQYDGLYVNDSDAESGTKKVYLTFDLGYEAGYTEAVLDILNQNNIKGVFFLCGHYIDKESDLVNRMLAEGHMIGNHTDKHKDLPRLSDDGIKTDITAFNEMFAEKYPDRPAPTFFRPPQGRFDARTLKIAKEHGMRTMLWSIAIVDWGKKPIDARACADKITGRIHPGAIVLFHITNSGTPEMLKLLIPQLVAKGYGFGSPGEL